MVPSSHLSRPPLIKTKFCVPQRRANVVLRPRLLSILSEGIQGALTLVCAPAGYGKTTLLTEWIASLPTAKGINVPSICWLSLDEGDNDPALFLGYLVEAFENAKSKLGGEARAMLQSFPQPTFRASLGILINDLQELATPVYLVLDDYHVITNPTIHEGIAFFLERLPAVVHVVIATRSDPPLPLAALRARNQMVEIRADVLRFQPDEAAAFLNQTMNLPLSAADIMALETRTEGWISGLQMAALAMKSRSKQEGVSFSEFVQAFSGSHRYILDYLAEEVLNRQPGNVQHFLSWTSILGRLCASLCDAVLAENSHTSQEMLETLDQSNLFLIALDDERQWYRYHQLFDDLLSARLRQAQPEAIPVLHLRASHWFEQKGYAAEAIQHAFSAQDYERAADLIERYGPARWTVSDTTIMLLAGNLPPKLLRSRPRLGIYQAWILIAQGQVDSAIPLLRDLKESVSIVDLQSPLAWIRSFADLLLAYISDPSEEPSQYPLPNYPLFDSMPAGDTGLRNTADLLYALVLGRQGVMDEPADILLNSIQRDAAVQGTTAVPLSVPVLARLRSMQGRLHEAANLCREHLKPIVKRGTKFYYTSGSLNIILGEVLREWNELEEAEEQIRTGIRANEPWNNIATDAFGYTALARVQEARGNVEGALETQRKLEELFAGRSRPRDWEGEQRSLRVRLWLAQGDLASAVEWADRFSFNDNDAHLPSQETDRLTIVRVRLAQGKFAEAQQILEAMEQIPGIEKRFNRKIKIGILLACALAGQNMLSRALSVLESSLALAEPEGHLRVFLDAGEPARELLEAYLRSPAAAHRTYARKLVDAFSGMSQGIPKVKSRPVLIESLTPRESEVLGLMAAGFSNRQIAGKLVLSEGTIKFHVHSILDKLQVHSRTAALVRARELELI